MVTAEHGEVCKPSLVIRAVERKVSLGAGRKADACWKVTAISVSITIVLASRYPMRRSSVSVLSSGLHRFFSFASSDCKKDVVRSKANMSSAMLPFYVTAHF